MFVSKRTLFLTSLLVALVVFSVSPASGHVTQKFGHLWNKHIKPMLATEGTINESRNPVDWTKLKGVPASIADGDDEVGAQGPAGPQGPQGPEGPTGPQGPAGPSGLSGYEVVTDTSAFDSNSPKSAGIGCSSGKRAVGGGANASNPVTALRGSFPIFVSGIPVGWSATAYETTATSSSWNVTAYVICVDQ